MKITEALLAEHVVCHQVFDHLESSLDSLRTVAELRAVARMLQSLLDHHSAIEPLEHCIDNLGHRETFHQEHEEIDDNLRRVQEVEDPDKVRRLLQAAVLLCREHFDKEERLVFPLAEQSLSERTLEELGRRWQEQRHARIGA